MRRVYRRRRKIEPGLTNIQAFVRLTELLHREPREFRYNFLNGWCSYR